MSGVRVANTSISADVDRQCRQVIEWNEGIEPSSSGWKPGALPIELIPHSSVLAERAAVAGARIELALMTGYEPVAAPILRVPQGLCAPSMGLEPTSFSSTGSCSNQLSYDGKRCSGGSPEGWVREARVANMSVYAVLGRKSRGVTVGTLGIEPRTLG